MSRWPTRRADSGPPAATSPSTRPATEGDATPRKIVDLLATAPEVLQDRPSDPRVDSPARPTAAPLTLLAAGYDHRIDAIVPQITGNN